MPQTNITTEDAPAARVLHGKGGENEEEEYLNLHTSRTFLQYRRACMNDKMRAKSTHPLELPDMEQDPGDDGKDHGRQRHHAPEECLAGGGLEAAGEEDEDEEEEEEEERRMRPRLFFIPRIILLNHPLSLLTWFKG